MKNRLDLKEQRRREALARNEEWQKLSPEEQLKELNQRLGVGIGAQKQRARLNKILTPA